MTIQQEAYQLIDTLPDDSLRIIVQLMHRLEPVAKKERSPFRFSDYVTPTDRAEHADAYVRELRENDRI